MVKGGDYDELRPLPVSTREPGEVEEGSRLLRGNGTSSSGPAGGGNGTNGGSKQHVGAFDVEFDVEDDVLLNWQHTRPRWCPSWLSRRLPWQLQKAPEWWLRLSSQQRSLVVSGAVASGVLLFCLAVVLAAVLGSSEGAVRYKPQYMSASESPYCAWSDLYLPRAVRPSLYKLHIKSSLQPPYVVTGEVGISITAEEATPCVVLHAHGMNITGVALRVFKGAGHHDKQEPVLVKGRVLRANTTLQQVILQFPEAVPRGVLAPVLQLAFAYPLTEGLDGFYRSSFTDAANETKVMASTQFESVAARKAFPCFDEPSFKAVFEVKVTAPPPPVVVLSNMPLSHTHEHEHAEAAAAAGGGDRHGSDKHGSGSSSSSSKHKQQLSDADLISYHFKPTPPMSSYLVAWVVGELQHSELQCKLDLPPPAWPSHGPRAAAHEAADAADAAAADAAAGGGRNVSVRTWGTSDRVRQFAHALQVACGSLREMERLTQVAYPLPKLDLVAIPNFAAGAMENWGLLTYRERSLLVDDTKDDVHQRYAIATTVAHETSHQWFGNLATLSDWNELWLNEGLATYFEAVLADAVQPTMGYLAAFFTDTTSPGLEADGSPASHPLTIARPIRKLSEIDNWFDGVSYSKGAAVLRMLRAWVNRADNGITGLVSSDAAASSTVSNPVEEARRASTTEQWSPRLLRRLQQQQAAVATAGSSGASLVPVLLQARSSSSSVGDDGAASSSSGRGHAWDLAAHHSNPLGGLLLDAAPDASGEAAAAGDLVVLPIDAAVPSRSSQQPDSSAAAGTRVLGTAAAVNPDSDKFVLGLRTYLAQHAYRNSNYTGLWAALGEATGEDVAGCMSTWTLRRGFPIVTVSLADADGTSNKRVVKLEQVPFHAPRTYMVGLPFEPEMYCNDWSDNPADSSWWIPVPLRLPGANNFAWHSFNNCTGHATIEMPQAAANNPWVLANTGRFGFYRTNYSEPLWAGLTAAATEPEAAISSVDFAGLLDDAYALSLVRQLNVSVFLELTKALGLRSRPELAPWSAGLGWLQGMAELLATAAATDAGGKAAQWQDCLANLRRVVTERVTQPFIQNVQPPGQDVPGLTFEVSPSDSPELRLLRPTVLQAAGLLGDSRITDMAVDLLTQQAAGGQGGAISPDVTKAVYALAAASGSDTAYTALRRMYEEAADAAHKDRLLSALSRVTTPALVNATLAYALTPAVRSQDVASLLTRLARQGGVPFALTWEFVIARADDILAKYAVDDVTYSLGRPLNSLAKLFVDEGLIERLKALARAKPQVFSPTFFEEANEARILNHDYLRFQGADACGWLAREARQR